MAPVQQRDVPDALHELGAGVLAHRGDECVPVAALACAYSHLHELVAVERPLQLRQDARAEPASADDHDRVAVVAESAQGLALRWAQGHAPNLSRRRIAMTRERKGRSPWMREHLRDPYVRRAQREGWRSRASFKLAELIESERLLRPGMLVIDLGAAPGGWSQYAAAELAGRGRVIAIDVLPMTGLAGVETLQGDLREVAMRAQLLERMVGARAGLVMSDMSPNITGVRSVDQPRSLELAELALDLATQVLAPGGCFVVKLFQGEGVRVYEDAVRRRFASVRSRKPDASRARSRELYVVAKGFLGGEEP